MLVMLGLLNVKSRWCSPWVSDRRGVRFGRTGSGGWCVVHWRQMAYYLRTIFWEDFGGSLLLFFDFALGVMVIRVGLIYPKLIVVLVGVCGRLILIPAESVANDGVSGVT